MPYLDIIHLFVKNKGSKVLIKPGSFELFSYNTYVFILYKTIQEICKFNCMSYQDSSYYNRPVRSAIFICVE